MPMNPSEVPAARRARLLSRGLAVLLILLLIADAPLVPMLLRSPVFSTLWAILAVHLGLLLAAIVGLLRVRPWGFYCLYVLVPFSTILLSISFVPHLPRPFPPELRPLVLTVANVAVLLVTAAAHASHRATRRAPAGV
jgi:hypothetical protein